MIGSKAVAPLAAVLVVIAGPNLAPPSARA